MTGNEKELSEIKGYVARLYQMIRHRTAVSVELTEEQNETADTLVIQLKILIPSYKLLIVFNKKKYMIRLKVSKIY